MTGGAAQEAPRDARRAGSAAAGRPPTLAAPALAALVFVCHGPSCSERGSPELCRRLRETVAASPARRALRICETSCLDHCATGPNLVLGETRRLITGVAPDDAQPFLRIVVGLPEAPE